MIGFLAGKVKTKEAGVLIIEINGVGFKVHVPAFVWQKAKIGDKKELLIYTHVREDEISLYGFENKNSKQIFMDLLSVSGIGPRLALNVVSSAERPERIVKAIEEAEVDFFTKIKGIGKKSSQRIIIDLKSKIGGLKDLEFETEADQDLLEALKGLGFSGKEIRKGMKGIKKDLPLTEKIRWALKNQDQK